MSEPKADRPSKIRVTNITRSHGKGGMGKFLDPGEKFGNRMIAPGHSMLFDCVGGTMPDCVETWKEAGYVMIHNAETGGVLAGPLSGELSPGTLSPVRPATGHMDDDLFDEEPDIGDAREATMENTKPISGNINQSRARVSLGTRDEEVVGGELSPIPGDRPRNLDSGMQSIRAPRSHAIGAVIGKK